MISRFCQSLDFTTTDSSVAATSNADLEKFNNLISQNRADYAKGEVVKIVTRAGIKIDPSQITANGNGHYAARIKHNNRRVEDESFRIVSVTVR